MKLPQHIAIIMDGNGRWAKRHSLLKSAGHLAGTKAIEPVVLHCSELGIKALSLYAFSTENWNRPKDEVSNLLSLFDKYIKKMDSYLKYNVRLKFFGDLSVFSEDLQEGMRVVEEKFKEKTGMVLGIAMNYGGRSEIVNAARNVAKKVEDGSFRACDVDCNLFEENLYAYGMPDVDLLIRPGGEFRISNFLLWQCAYAEFVFMEDVLWPSFKPKHIDAAIEEFCKRNRTYGGRSN